MTGKSTYTEEIADKICEELARGKSLVKICDEIDVSYSTIMKWLRDFDDFSQKYAHAREAQADYLADEIIQIADDSTHDSVVDEDGNLRLNTEFVARSRLKVDSRKWIASKLLPKKYGDRQEIDLSGSVNLSNLSKEQLALQLAEALSLAGISNSGAGIGEKESGK